MVSDLIYGLCSMRRHEDSWPRSGLRTTLATASSTTLSVVTLMPALPRAARRRANEHEQRHEDLGEIRHIPQRDAVVARCAGRRQDWNAALVILSNRFIRPRRERLLYSMNRMPAVPSRSSQPVTTKPALCVCAGGVYGGRSKGSCQTRKPSPPLMMSSEITAKTYGLL